MNMKKKMKAFFTMNRHANEGFTLVELIVVIAILAILAGVAVPAYSGYIEKAERAADDQLLGTLNTAFAAACAFNGESNYGRSDNPSITINAGAVASNALNTANDAINLSFAEFFEGGTFKSVTGLVYMPGSGAFVRGGTMTFSFGGQQITLNVSDVAILSGDNAFSDRGSAALLNDVAVLENLLSTGIGNEVLTDVKRSDAFLWALGGYAGMEQGEDESDDAYLDKVYMYMQDPANEDAVYNAQIMFAANNAAHATQAQIDKLFTGTVTGNIAVMNPDGTRNNEATMANAALAYGMYTAYMQRYPTGDENGRTDFVNVVTSDAFESYYETDDFKTDLEAYMAAMNMISDNTSNSKVTADILANGIAGNTELAELMKEVMGN